MKKIKKQDKIQFGIRWPTELVKWIDESRKLNGLSRTAQVIMMITKLKNGDM